MLEFWFNAWRSWMLYCLDRQRFDLLCDELEKPVKQAIQKGEA